MNNVKETLEIFGNHFDTWFSERSLFVPDEEGKTKVDRAFEVMKERGYIFEQEGATYFRSTAFGDEKTVFLLKPTAS